MLQKGIFLHNLVAEQMFLDDPLNDWGRCSTIPNSIGVDHQHGTLATDPQAICLRAENAMGAIVGWLLQPQFFEAAFQVIPSG
jgi:hypothetical protein